MKSYRAVVFLLLVVSLCYALEYCSFEENKNRFTRDASSGSLSLYDENDQVLELTSADFDEILLNSSRTHVVQFYLNWCGHCRRFSPAYKQFAADIKPWDDIVGVVAIDCALAPHRVICGLNGVVGTPYLKFYPRNISSYSDSIKMELKTRDVEELRQNSADLIASDYSSHDNHLDWPNFNYLEENQDHIRLWASVKDSVQFMALIFERNASSTLGAQMILDLHKESDWIVVRRALSTHNLAQAFSMNEFPKLLVFHRAKRGAPLYQSKLRQLLMSKLRPLKELIQTATPAPTASRAPQFRQTAPTSPPTLADLRAKKSKYFVAEKDILLASKRAMHDDVILTGRQFSDENRTALMQMVDVLRKYFPQTLAVQTTLRYLSLPNSSDLVKSEQARQVFNDLYSFLRNRPVVTAEEWSSAFQAAETAHGNPFPSNATYEHCKGSSPIYRGYTCGVWTLFHTLTVNAYLEDGLKSDFRPLYVPKAIQGWVGSFFGCAECRTHFMEMTNTTLRMENWVRYPSDVVLYLWKAHNTVNKRLAGDRTEDPQFPKFQFPPKFLCDNCKDNSPKPRWDSRACMRYLLNYYTDIRPTSE